MKRNSLIDLELQIRFYDLLSAKILSFFYLEALIFKSYILKICCVQKIKLAHMKYSDFSKRSIKNVENSFLQK